MRSNCMIDQRNRIVDSCVFMMNVLFLLNVSCSLLITHKWNIDVAPQLMNLLIKRSPCC